MKTPAFWDIRPPDWRATLLRPLGWIYGRITARRMARSGCRLPIPVICVGNLTAGGAGKTPTVQWLIVRLQASGVTPLVLSRGYGGRLEGPVVVDPAIHSAAEVGDEPLLLARSATVIVARDRVAGADLALAEGAACLIMDDGLQNPALDKTLTLAVIDGASGFGNGLCLPAGPLRAPPAAQWPHIGHVMLIGEGPAGDEAAQQARAAGIAVSRATLQPDRAVAARLHGQRVLAVSGIGRPDKFRATLEELGAKVIAERRNRDHATYTAQDIDELAADARRHHLLPVTTEKDAIKLMPLWQADRHGELVVLPVSLQVQDASGLEAALAPVLRR